MTDLDRLKLLCNVEPLWAEQMLRERGGSLTADELRRLVLLSTGDSAEASAAWSRRVLEEREAKFRAGG